MPDASQKSSERFQKKCAVWKFVELLLRQKAESAYKIQFFCILNQANHGLTLVWSELVIKRSAGSGLGYVMVPGVASEMLMLNKE